MGNHHAGRAMGREAQILYERRQPGERAIDLLDRVCEPWRNCDAEFEAEDPNTPTMVHPEYQDYTAPHPACGLGMLILEAFASDRTAEFQRLYTEDLDPAESDALSERHYEEVVSQFKKRYDFY
ncbi:hypothetical protein CKO28_00630 [Rhodovibrio sodomensis]|uniref:Uncharacterized protein n=1 Tax=Rhodovibrio sodomensis TaxID=1088 RepID=A0ABS1D9H3_9PROT|nr:hypothetical protein [Rhodovibrio sodomensis]MBK1666546.1 hypothetical protein [Rhodovibrio sodomensis]